MRSWALLGAVVVGAAASVSACAQILGDFDDNAPKGAGGSTSSTSGTGGKASSSAATGGKTSSTGSSSSRATSSSSSSSASSASSSSSSSASSASSSSSSSSSTSSGSPLPAGSPCTANAQCQSDVCGVSGTGTCCTAACNPTTAPCGATSCDTTGACVFPANTTACGGASCMGSKLTTQSTCDGSGSCGIGGIGPCPGNLMCADATACKTACSVDADCVSGFHCQNPGASGTCVAQGNAGAACTANDQCSSGACGITGSGHCCASPFGCPGSVGACGATDCDTTGQCAYPGGTTAPASLQTPGDCQKVVCNGGGGTTTVDDPTDIPVSSSACLISPACCGPSPLTPCFKDAPTGTSCKSGNDPDAFVCGNTGNPNVAGVCIECNTDGDCLALNDAGTSVCDTTVGTCVGCVASGDTAQSCFDCCNGCADGGSTTCP